MTNKIIIEVDRASFVSMLNVLADALLEDSMLRVMNYGKSEMILSSGTPCAVKADVSFFENLLPEMEEKYPDIFLYHSPISRLLEAIKSEK